MNGGKDLETYEKLLPWRERGRAGAGAAKFRETALCKIARKERTSLLGRTLSPESSADPKCSTRGVRRGTAAKKPPSRGHKCRPVEGTRASPSKASWVCSLQTPKSDFKPHVLFIRVPRVDPRTEEGNPLQFYHLGKPFHPFSHSRGLKDLWSHEGC